MIDVVTTVSRVVTVQDCSTDPAFEAPEYTLMKTMAVIMARRGRHGHAVRRSRSRASPTGYRLGAGLQLTTGEAAGPPALLHRHRRRPVLPATVTARPNLERFNGVKAGDEIHVDNRKFLAFCYFHRHHLMDDAQFDSLRLDGSADLPAAPGAADVAADGRVLLGPLRGQAALDPPHPRLVAVAVAGHHLPAAPSGRRRAPRRRPRSSGCSGRRTPSTSRRRICPIGSAPGHRHLADRLLPSHRAGPRRPHRLGRGGRRAAEHHVRATSTAQVILPATAAERGGIQPVVIGHGQRCARGRGRGRRVGAVPGRRRGAAGRRHDRLGRMGLRRHGVPSRSATTSTAPTPSVSLTTSHTYDTPGTYFVTARVQSNREGDAQATPPDQEHGGGASRRQLDRTDHRAAPL